MYDERLDGEEAKKNRICDTEKMKDNLDEELKHERSKDNSTNHDAEEEKDGGGSC